MTLQSEADALYATLPEDFIAARNERAKAARASGDRELAAQIRKLPKPRLAAWVLNMLVRRKPDEVDELVDLGAEIRAAQADADREELRALDAQRRQVTRALTEQARTVAADLDHHVNDPLAAELENSLRTAMADPVGGAALRTGLLVDSFGTTGFEAVDVERVVAVPGAVSVSPEPQRHLRVVREPPKKPAPKKAAAKAPAAKPPVAKKAATATTKQPAPKPQPDPEVGVRRQAHEASQAALLTAREAHADAQRNREQLESERATLQDRLRTVDRELTAAHRAEDRAEREQQRAERKCATAARAMERAASRAGPASDA